MAKSTIELEIVALFKDANAAVKKFSSDTQKQLDSIDFKGTVTAINAGFELIQKTAGAAFSEIKDFIGDAIDEAIQGEDALNKLSNSMRLVGDFSEGAVKGFEDFAQQLSRTTTLSDDAVISGLALAKNFNLTNKEAKSLVSAAADLSAATGVDLTSAIDSLGKSMNGVVDKSLSKYIPALKTATKEQLALGLGVEATAQRFKGSASALSNTFGGSLINLNKGFNDFLKTIGDIIIGNQTLIKSIQIITETFNDLSDTVNKNESILSLFISNAVIGFAGLLAPAVKVIKFIDGVLSSIINLFNAVGSYLGAFGARIVEILKGNFKGAEEIAEQNAKDILDSYRKTSQRLESFYDPLIKAAEITSKKIQSIDITNTKKRSETVAKEDDRVNEERIRRERLFQIQKQQAEQEFQSIRQKLEEAGLSEIEKINKEAYKNISIVRKALQTGVIADAVQAQKYIANIEIDRAKRVAEEQKKINDKLLADQKDAFDKQQKELTDLTKNPFSALFPELKPGQQGALNQEQSRAAAVGLGGVSTALKGEAGAKELFKGAASTLASSVLGPAFGPVVGEIVDVLSQGPDKVREMIQSFVKAIPEIIKNIILAIPVLIEELLKAGPQLIKLLVESAPEIILGIISELPKLIAALISYIPSIALSLSIGLIKEIPNIVKTFAQEFLKIPGQFIDALLDLIPGGKGITGAIFGGGGDDGGLFGGGGFLGLGLAEGGQVPDLAKFAGDKFPARLSAGELVIDKGLTNELAEFIRSSDSGSQNVTVVVQVQENELARAIFNLNRRGARLA